jgi:hypothetical protein
MMFPLEEDYFKKKHRQDIKPGVYMVLIEDA